MIQPAFPAPDPADDAPDAAAWAARLDAGPLSDSEQTALEAWLARAPGHAAELETCLRLCRTLRDAMPGLGPAVDPPGPRPSQAPAQGEAVRPRISGRVWGAGLAAAILLALLFWPESPEAFETASAARRSVTLTDGSRIDLNARTRLAVRFGDSDRVVTLHQGEAFFEVAPDPARPLEVRTPAGTVRVLGTSFGVRSESPDAVQVVVVEGAVAVRPGSTGDEAPEAIRLQPGDRLEHRGGHTAVARLTAEEARDSLAWREGKVVVTAARLEDVAARFARYHGRSIEVLPAARDLALGGAFRLDELDGFLTDIVAVLPVEVLREREGRVVIGPRARISTPE